MVTEKKNIKNEKKFFHRKCNTHVCLINTANSEWIKHPYQKLLHFLMFDTIGIVFFG